jgi:hypothetical protein
VSPPLSAGGCQTIIAALSRSTSATTLIGAPGTVAGTTGALNADAGDSP